MPIAPLTIAVDLTPVLPGGENGGAKIFVVELLRELALIAPGFSFVLLTRTAAHEELAILDAPNVRRVCVLGPAGRDSGAIPSSRRLLRAVFSGLAGRGAATVAALGLRVRGLLRRTRGARRSPVPKADLLFCPFTAPTYAIPGVPVVCTVHDLQHRAYPQFFQPEEVAHRDAVFRAACATADAVVAVSDFTRASVLDTGLVQPSRVRTIRHRIASRLVGDAPGGTGILARYGLEPRRFLLYPANPWQHKNHEMLLTAFALACRDGLPAGMKLVCTGARGDRSRFLEDAVAAFGLADRVVIGGYLDAPQLQELLAQAAGLVFPSLYEGFGLPVLEAMGAGIPVACSNTASLPEVAGDAALLFDPRCPADLARAMTVLVADGPTRGRLTAAGLQRAAMVSDVRQMAGEYRDLFHEILMRRAPAGCAA